MVDVEVIEEPAAAVVALDPIRARLLAALREPASAAALAAEVGLTRQKVNYHLRALEAHGLVRVAEERQWGGLTERVLVATAASYVVSPAALGAAQADPARAADRLSARYLIALAARAVREVGELTRRADRRSARVATLGLDTEIRFASAADRAAFAEELTAAVTHLAARYHDPSADGGRDHRVLVAVHPIPRPEAETGAARDAETKTAPDVATETAPDAEPRTAPDAEPRTVPGAEIETAREAETEIEEERP